jgi:N-glycosylase/DNA lyase
MWYVINGSDLLAINEDAPLEFRSFQKNKYDFFRETDNIDKIIRSMSKDTVLRHAAKRFEGLRILRQDPFQCYISFILSSNSSIQNIRNSLWRLAKKFGPKIIFDRLEFHLLPEPDKLANAENSELLSCGLGYRAKFVKKASLAVKEGILNFDLLKKANYQEAKSALLDIDGIGNKVADCILLFSLEKLESFPLDRWIVRSLEEYYPQRFSFSGKTLTDRKYRLLHDEAVKYFGPHAGYCQQFLFKMIRESNKKSW